MAKTIDVRPEPPPPFGGQNNRNRQPRRSPLKIIGRFFLYGFGFVVLIGLIIFAALFVWYGCRIEPGNGQLAILIRKTGDDLKPGEIIATRPGQKGIQLEPLPEGRYFCNPLTWDWRIVEITTIPPGQLGVVVRLYGDDLPPGEIIAKPGQKGILAEVLKPGKYRINPYAEMVLLDSPITIRAGHVGVQTHLVGEDILHGDMPENMKFAYVVGENVKGVQARTLAPGTHFLNPYMYSVAEINLQSQRFELQGDDAISFLTQDGFTVVVEGTLEFAIERDRVAMLTHQVGDMDDILKKIVLPKARGFSRIEGSKHPAIDFIVGETRQEFQNQLERHLITQCAKWGVTVRSVLIRNITPPEEVTAIIREREVALQNQKKIEQQIIQAKSQAELTRQEMLAVQNREKVESETAAIRAKIQAEQEQSVKLTSGQRELDVVRIEAKAAKLQAEAVLIKAGADRDVIRMHNEAAAAVAKTQVEAFGGGVDLARYTLYLKAGPMLQSIISTDREPGLGALFKPLLPPGGTVSPPPAAPRKENANG